MQLGELQSQIERFEDRGVRAIALSVDLPDDSLAMIERLGLTFDLGSDPDQRVVKAFRVQNPDTQELALHAVYLVDADGEVFYRKVARRRPTSEELIDAIDAFRGVYPKQDERRARGKIVVAYPQNNYQALIEMTQADVPADSIDRDQLNQILTLIGARRGDDALISFRKMARAAGTAARDDLYAAAAWLARRTFLDGHPEALELGADLARRVQRVGQLEGDWRAAAGTEKEDDLLHTLARARAGLALTRAEIDQHASDWNLRFAKSVLRSYREVARAATEA